MKKAFFLTIFLLFLNACFVNSPASNPSIEFSKVPVAYEGGPTKVAPIEGRVTKALQGQKIVLYSHSGVWWVQPKESTPFTDIQPDLTWKNSTHLGFEYAALLVEPNYLPKTKINELPTPGNGVIAVAVVPGTPDTTAGSKIIQFSGYEWSVQNKTSDPGGTVNTFDPANVRVDDQGFLHLRISKSSGQWTAAEIRLSRSLGYGNYKFVVQDTSHLEPAAVLGLYTWDELDAAQNHRGMNIDISQWGDPDNKNLQYVIQPYSVPANIVRFNVPAGELVHTLRWEPGKAVFESVQSAKSDNKPRVVVQYNFITGVPVPGGETIHLDLYIYGYAKKALQDENEVVTEKFEYLP